MKKISNPADDTPTPRPIPHKVFDISRPGRTPASATSRPVILGHKPNVQDDINGISARASDPAETQNTLIDSKNRITVQPVGALNQDVEVTSADAVPAPVPVDAAVAPVPASSSEGSQHEPLELDLEALSQARRNDTATAARGTEVKDELLAKAAKDLDATAGPTITPTASQGIVVSHHKPGILWGRLLLTLLIVALAALVVLNFLLDAGVLSPDSTLPHTNFFK